MTSTVYSPGIRDINKIIEHRMNRIIFNFPGRFIFFASIVFGVSFLVKFILAEYSILPPYIENWVVALVMGVVAGLAVRLLLNKHSVVVLLLMAILALAASMLLLGWIFPSFEGWNLAGIGNESAGSIWIFLSQLILASFFALLVSLPRSVKTEQKRSLKKKKSMKQSTKQKAKKSTPKTQKRAKVQPVKSRKSVPSRNPKSQPKSNIKLPPVMKQKYWNTQWKRIRSKTNLIWHNGQNASRSLRTKLSINSKRPHILKRSSKRRVSPSRRRIKFVRMRGRVEHRCPYCLDLVEVNDPRGVRICPDCHTRHHADCWAVTGTCQVPHEF